MAFEDAPATSKTKDKDFQSVPSCSCGRTAAVAIATVTNTSTGEVSRGAASEFCGRDNQNKPNGKLLDWYILNSFVGICSACWYGEKKPGQRKYRDDQVSVAWRWFLNKITADSETLGGTFKPVRLSPEQQDIAIEIVNYEAARCHMPEVIPELYRIVVVDA